MLRTSDYSQMEKVIRLLETDNESSYIKLLTDENGTCSSFEFDGTLSFDTLAEIVDTLQGKNTGANLRATTEEQQNYIESLAEEESCDGEVCVYNDCIDYLVDSCYSVGISFDTMAKIVDYLRETK